MTNNVAGALAYLFAPLGGVLFLVLEPYNKDRFVRFHAFQSIFFGLAAFEASKRHKWPWLFVVLAGLAVGMAVTEGADNGAIYSVFLAAYVAY